MPFQNTVDGWLFLQDPGTPPIHPGTVFTARSTSEGFRKQHIGYLSAGSAFTHGWGCFAVYMRFEGKIAIRAHDGAQTACRVAVLACADMSAVLGGFILDAANRWAKKVKLPDAYLDALEQLNQSTGLVDRAPTHRMAEALAYTHDDRAGAVGQLIWAAWFSPASPVATYVIRSLTILGETDAEAALSAQIEPAVFRASQSLGLTDAQIPTK